MSRLSKSKITSWRRNRKSFQKRIFQRKVFTGWEISPNASLKKTAIHQKTRKQFSRIRFSLPHGHPHDYDQPHDWLIFWCQGSFALLRCFVSSIAVEARGKAHVEAQCRRKTTEHTLTVNALLGETFKSVNTKYKYTIPVSGTRNNLIVFSALG